MRGSSCVSSVLYSWVDRYEQFCVLRQCRHCCLNQSSWTNADKWSQLTPCENLTNGYAMREDRLWRERGKKKLWQIFHVSLSAFQEPLQAHRVLPTSNTIVFAAQTAFRPSMASGKAARVGPVAQLMAPYLQFDHVVEASEVLGSRAAGYVPPSSALLLRPVKSLRNMDLERFFVLCIVCQWIVRPINFWITCFSRVVQLYICCLSI